MAELSKSLLITIMNQNRILKNLSNFYMVELQEAEKPIFAIIDFNVPSMSRQHLGLTTQFPSQGMG